MQHSSSSSSSPLHAATLIADYILTRHQQSHMTASNDGSGISKVTQLRPLMVSMQGPQGAGKSTIAYLLVNILKQHKLTCVVASLDDFYLTHVELEDLAHRNPVNGLLHGRGQPGTHDVDLLIAVLEKVQQGEAFQLPVFDKSLFQGEGDRCQDGILVIPPVDVFILEGWSIGFQPVNPDDLDATYRAATHQAAHQRPLFLNHSLESLQAINDNLREFASRVYPFFEIHVILQAQSREYVYTWRLQQEHTMKTKNGGHGMLDGEVKLFVDRYMPSYELFEEGILEHWSQRAFIVSLGEDRSVLGHRAI
ncbi:P-loop containing nucleoside triphosphate hydrolase protein [Naematelia encephala]|uniref:p-loop containing nucleoside triphosphate hydrolase protein n=1 Tax=Naematelia encephala TaxID=71784 RepID=A0A1Y2B7Q8_9TREE|nr:P-loop containing nucleoside triphosphate hydrolase protein [Naematelia encephala]